MSVQTFPSNDIRSHRRSRFKLDDLITVEQLASAVHVKVRTVRDWIAKRKIPFTRIDGRVLFATGVIEEILRKNAVEPLPRPTLAEQGGAQTTKGIEQ